MTGSVLTADACDGPPVDHRFTLMWTDPPFGTGKTMRSGSNSYHDHDDTDYVLDGIAAWLPAMTDDATVVVCCDYRLAAKAIGRIEREGWHYNGEIIWQFGLGRPRTTWWPVRHNNLLTFTRAPGSGRFDKSAVPRERRRAPKPGYPDDKPAGSVWDFTMSNTHPDRVGYPNQKPIEIVSPFVLAHTVCCDWVCDPFCGSGTVAIAAAMHGRRFVISDSNPEATAVALQRLAVC